MGIKCNVDVQLNKYAAGVVLYIFRWGKAFGCGTIFYSGSRFMGACTINCENPGTRSKHVYGLYVGGYHVTCI